MCSHPGSPPSLRGMVSLHLGWALQSHPAPPPAVSLRWAHDISRPLPRERSLLWCLPPGSYGLCPPGTSCPAHVAAALWPPGEDEKKSPGVPSITLLVLVSAGPPSTPALEQFAHDFSRIPPASVHGFHHKERPVSTSP